MEEQKRCITINHIICCLPNCKAKKRTERNLSFHCIPSERKYLFEKDESGITKQKDLRATWLEAIKIQGEPTKGMKVCSKHFKNDDFVEHLVLGNRVRRCLKSHVVPSVNLPEQKFCRRLTQKSVLKKRQTKKKNVILHNSATPTICRSHYDPKGILYKEYVYNLADGTPSAIVEINKERISDIDILVTKRSSNTFGTNAFIVFASKLE